MPRMERQLQAAYDKGMISLREFHEALSQIGTRHDKDIAKKKNRDSMSSTKWF